MEKYGRSVLKNHSKVMTGSSDIGMHSSRSNGYPLTGTGNVSYNVPTIHPMFGIAAPRGSYPHHPTFTGAAGTDEAHQDAVVVGKSLALIGWDMIKDDEMYETAKRQWQEAIKEQ